MESRACGGCGSGGFMTLSTTNEDGARIDRLAYLQTLKDTPPASDGSDGGTLELKFYEVWNEYLWHVLFGDEPTIEDIQRLVNEGKLRLSKLIKSPSGTIRARIYDTGTLTFTADGDEKCDGYPTLHKSFTVTYTSSKVD